MCENESVKD